MIQIIDKKVNLDFPLGHHLHCLIAQVPNHLRKVDHAFSVVDPTESWPQIEALLEMVIKGEGNLKKLHFLMLPEASVSRSRFETIIEMIDRGFRPNSVVMFGMEHVTLKEFRGLLERFREDNEEAIEYVDRDIDSGDVLEMPVNWCCIAVKESCGKLRVFLEAKSHPFHGEEFLDKFHDLYRGRHVYLFRSRPSCFNFMTLICFDYLYRDLYSSNIKQIVDHANKLFFTTRQGLDAIFVIQCNPKPEHQAYRDIVSGFYGEYLEDLPGVRETTTVFGNSSRETTIEGVTFDGDSFGRSAVMLSRRHPLAEVSFSEFSTDDFNGTPASRLRFGTGTRLYYFNLPIHHELDPRSSRVPLKVHSIMKWTDGTWSRISGDEMVGHYDINLS